MPKKTLFQQVAKFVKKHLKQHFYVPFLISFLLEGLTEWFLGDFFNHDHKALYALLRFIVLLTSLFITYAFILWMIQREEAKYSYTTEIANVLKKHLKDDAIRFFAVSVDDVKTWFAPASLQYFIESLRYDGLEYERVFFFLEDNQADFNEDIHQGESIANVLTVLHRQARITLSYLKPSEIVVILDNLSPATKQVLRIKRTIWKKQFKFPYSKNKIRKILDFAIIEKSGRHPKVVLRVNKLKRNVDEIFDDKKVVAYEEIVKKIEEKIYESRDERVLHAKNDFSTKANQDFQDYVLVRLSRQGNQNT
jgi:hypothetical protein